MDAIGPVILTLDKICLGIFVVELALKLYAHRWQFWRSGWNIFDFIIIGIALMPATQGFSVLRALRILRLLRGGVGQPQPAARGGRVHHSAARHGVGVFC